MRGRNAVPSHEQEHGRRSVRLSRMLLFWFLSLALLPLAGVSVLSYRSARESLERNASESLAATTKLKTAHIRSYFDRLLIDLQEHSEARSNVLFLQALRSALADSGKSVREFTRSFKWELLVHENAADLKNLQRLFDYRDIFLIDAAGNVLFTVEREDDLGTNLFTGEYSDTLFAAACRASLDSGRAAFSDYEFYTPSGGTVTAFLAAPVVDDEGEKIGLFAMQLRLDRINDIMQEGAGLGQTGESFLIGGDLTMRSDSRLAEESTVLAERIETEQTQLWLAVHGDAADPLTCQEPALANYLGHRGALVLGTHSTIEVAGVRLGVIAEIEEREAFAPAIRLRRVMIGLLIGTAVVILLVSVPVAKEIVHPILTISSAAARVADGVLDLAVSVRSRNEIGALAADFNTMVGNLRRTKAENEAQAWLKTGQAELSAVMRGEKDTTTLCEAIIASLAEHVNAQIGIVALTAEDGKHLVLTASYAYRARENAPTRFAVGEGLVGQAAQQRQRILLTDVSADAITVTSAMSEVVPRNIVCFPFLHEGAVKGVIELGFLRDITDLQLGFLDQVGESIGIAVHSVQSRDRMAALLEDSQRLTKELRAQQEELRMVNDTLQSQQEELRATNEELEQQAARLMESETTLKVQQEELQVTNEELEAKNRLTARQKEQVERARKDIEEKAKQLALASKYKSEFLANMSHELRTPLNSLLLLAQGLAQNSDGNLSGEQVESLQIIHHSGKDLLGLINEILDLSKIEAGRIELRRGTVRVSDLADEARRSFGHMAEEKGLQLDIVVSEDAPADIWSDRQRVGQIVRNLVSNAIKFTDTGSVRICFFRPASDADLPTSGPDSAQTLAVAVTDTGIGISPEQQQLIFEAFQQADGGTARRYGGTGLGLSISRELARLLGGRIQLDSRQGEGATFTLYLPVAGAAAATPAPSPSAQTVSAPEPAGVAPSSGLAPMTTHPQFEDDRETLKEGDRAVLLIEDDPAFAVVLHGKCHERGFKCVAVPTGEAGLEFAAEHSPCAVILDIHLPGMDGWAVLTALKDDTRTRHIPVYVVSVERAEAEALRRGAIGHAAKPLDQERLEQVFCKFDAVLAGGPKQVLVVEDNAAIRDDVVTLLGSGDMAVDQAETGAEALAAIRTGNYDCIVLDLGLPDMDGTELLMQLEREGVDLPPVVVHTARDLTREDEEHIRGLAQSIVIKDVRSRERLWDEVSLFLHRAVNRMSAQHREMIQELHDSDELLKGKKVLVVDDDMRTTFAVSKLLSSHGVHPLKAGDGERALRTLDEHPDVALVLMDVMMPVMDGYETVRRIRAADDGTRNVPIIALTAKAMAGDRSKCLAAGANDYLTKPVDAVRLISMIRNWLVR